MGTWRRVFAACLLSCILVLTGCVSFSVKTTLNPDGSGTRSISAVLTKNATDLLLRSGPGGTTQLERQLRAGLPPGTRLRKFTRGGELNYEASFDFASVRELNAITKGESRKTGVSGASASLEVRPGLIFTTYSFRENLPPIGGSLTDQEKSVIRTFSVTYSLTMPGTITQSNADRTIDSSSGEWKIDLLAGREIRATAAGFNWPVIAAIAFGAIAVVALVIVLILRIRARRSRGPAEEEAPPETNP